jgi:hypothetical protein
LHGEFGLEEIYFFFTTIKVWCLHLPWERLIPTYPVGHIVWELHANLRLVMFAVIRLYKESHGKDSRRETGHEGSHQGEADCLKVERGRYQNLFYIFKQAIPSFQLNLCNSLFSQADKFAKWALPPWTIRGIMFWWRKGLWQGLQFISWKHVFTWNLLTSTGKYQIAYAWPLELVALDTPSFMLSVMCGSKRLYRWLPSYVCCICNVHDVTIMYMM